MLMEPVWSPDMQCTVQHTHSSPGWDLALIHNEYPSGRIPSSVVPSSPRLPPRKESTPRDGRDALKNKAAQMSEISNYGDAISFSYFEKEVLALIKVYI